MTDHSKIDWQAECLKKGFEYVRESDDHYVLADVPEMAALLGQLLGVEVRDKENHSYGETVSELNEQIEAANNAFHRAYELEKEVEELRNKVEHLECMTENHKIDAKVHREAAEVAAKKLRSAEICHPRAVETLIGEAREALAAYLPEGWPQSAMSKEPSNG